MSISTNDLKVVVIPANAGIHVPGLCEMTMDPSVRWDDECVSIRRDDEPLFIFPGNTR